jgi:hypothetical protein
MTNPLCTFSDFAADLPPGFTKRAIERASRAGRFPPFAQFAGRRFYNRAEVAEWIAAHLAPVAKGAAANA